MQFIEPKKQTVWRWPAVLNFAFGSAGAGFYLLCQWLGLGEGGTKDSSLGAWQLAAPGLILLGFAAVATEAGRPFRARFVFRNLRQSWMSREALAAAIFVPVSVLGWLIPHPAWNALGQISAAAFIVSQGFIVYRARGLAAWNHPMVPLLFVSSGFASGAGLLLALVSWKGPGAGALVALLAAVAVNTAAWFAYVFGSNQPAFREATHKLRGAKEAVIGTGVLRGLPAFIVGAAWGWTGAQPESWDGVWPWAASLAGLMVFGGGVRQTACVILRAGYLRPIELGAPTTFKRGNLHGVSNGHEAGRNGSAAGLSGRLGGGAGNKL